MIHEEESDKIDFSWILFVGVKLLGLRKKEVGRLTYRTFKNLYYHYQNYYDFTLKQISYQKLEEIMMENDEWLK